MAYERLQRHFVVFMEPHEDRWMHCAVKIFFLIFEYFFVSIQHILFFFGKVERVNRSNLDITSVEKRCVVWRFAKC